MEATSVITLKLPKIRLPNVKARRATTVFGEVVTDFTPLPVDIPLSEEPEYSDEQFHADLRKASKQLDLMESKALEEHAQGKTRKFPV